MKLSAVILTKNEERNIERCIRSVLSISDEVIVVDSGSTDRTLQIARSLGARVVVREWEGYVKQKNYAVSLARGEWVLSLDADEELTRELAREIERTLSKPAYDCYLLNRQTYFLGKFLEHGWFPEWRLRLFRRGKGVFVDEGHDVCRCDGSVGKIKKGVMHHYSFESLEEHFAKNIRYARMVSELLYKRGKRPGYLNLLLNPTWHFIKVFFIKRAFLEGRRGLIVSASGAFYTFMKYAFLLEMHLKERFGKKVWERE